jgi:hypothetical protein
MRNCCKGLRDPLAILMAHITEAKLFDKKLSVLSTLFMPSPDGSPKSASTNEKLTRLSLTKPTSAASTWARPGTFFAAAHLQGMALSVINVVRLASSCFVPVDDRINDQR